MSKKSTIAAALFFISSDASPAISDESKVQNLSNDVFSLLEHIV